MSIILLPLSSVNYAKEVNNPTQIQTCWSSFVLTTHYDNLLIITCKAFSYQFIFTSVIKSLCPCIKIIYCIFLSPKRFFKASQQCRRNRRIIFCICCTHLLYRICCFLLHNSSKEIFLMKNYFDMISNANIFVKNSNGEERRETRDENSQTNF